jgi:hypothetical protein
VEELPAALPSGLLGGMAQRGSFRRRFAWTLVLGGVAVACGGDTTSGGTASLTGGTATAGAGGAATGGAATGGAATGGAATGGAATGGAATGGAATGGAAGADCTGLSSALESAVNAFAPASPNSCVLDSDCTVVATTIDRNNRLCWSACPMVVTGHCWAHCPIAAASQWGAEWTAFLADDPAITAACDALRTAGCVPFSSSCPCALLDPAVCGSPQCVSGVCQ